MATHIFLKLVTSNSNAKYLTVLLLTVLLLTKSNSNGNVLLLWSNISKPDAYYYIRGLSNKIKNIRLSYCKISL